MGIIPKKFSEQFVQITIPFAELENPEVLKRLTAPNYLIVYLFLRRYVCRDKNNPIAGKLYEQGYLTSYVSRKQIAEALNLNPTRISQIFTQMQEWGDIKRAGYTGKHVIWELGKIEEIETPQGTTSIEVFYFDLHLIGEKKEALS